jgi:hypothetical protein
MKRLIIVLVIIAAAVLGGGFYNGKTCVNDQAPQAAVENYVRSMKEKRFEDAYDVVTASMTDGKARDEWAAGQREMFELGEVEIGELDVRSPHRAKKNAFFCEDRALVPNVLNAKDRFNNQGSAEFEVYTVIKDGGAWKLDSQETLFEEPEIREWFPDDEIPEFPDQL